MTLENRQNPGTQGTPPVFWDREPCWVARELITAGLVKVFYAVLRFRIRDSVPFWHLDPGWVKKLGAGINNPDHISESLETIFWVKIPVLKFFDADPGPGMEKIRIQDGKNFDPG
jgi:hypothetical protein